MRIIQVAKAGKMMSQPHGPKPSGKLDTQIFLEKDDPSLLAQNKRKKKKKTKKANCDEGSCNICESKRNNRRA